MLKHWDALTAFNIKISCVFIPNELLTQKRQVLNELQSARKRCRSHCRPTSNSCSNIHTSKADCRLHDTQISIQSVLNSGISQAEKMHWGMATSALQRSYWKWGCFEGRQRKGCRHRKGCSQWKIIFGHDMSTFSSTPRWRTSVWSCFTARATLAAYAMYTHTHGYVYSAQHPNAIYK